MRGHDQAFCDRLRRLCSVHPQRVAGEIVGISETMVSRIKKRGFTAGRTRSRRARPGDFAIQARHMSVADLARHYRAGTSTVVRWGREVGRPPRWFLPIPPKLRPPRDVLAATIEREGLKGAEAVFGVCRTTLDKWRRDLGLPFRGMTPPPARGWADRYLQDRREREAACTRMR